MEEPYLWQDWAAPEGKKRKELQEGTLGLVYPIALANLVLHEIDEPHIWHGNTLTGLEVYGGLFSGAPSLSDIVLTNPPFGGKEGKDAQIRFAYKTSATQCFSYSM